MDFRTAETNGQRFVFNLELMVDAYSGGFVGMSARDEEDSAAVTEALSDGVATTHEAPLAVLLDNRPSNHTPQVDAALGTLITDGQVTQQAGQVKLGPVGSTAVRAAIERHQPIASLHGHVHESAGFRRIGQTLALNPGSDYGTGSLNGALVTVSGDKLKSHQLVRG